MKQLSILLLLTVIILAGCKQTPYQKIVGATHAIGWTDSQIVIGIGTPINKPVSGDNTPGDSGIKGTAISGDKLTYIGNSNNKVFYNDTCTAFVGGPQSIKNDHFFGGSATFGQINADTVRSFEIHVTTKEHSVGIISVEDSGYTAAYADCDTCPLTVLDSAATIKVLMQVNKRIMKQSRILYAAQDALRYVTMGGRITDYKAFGEAVKEYQELKNKKP